MKKPSANTPAVFSSCAVGLLPGKKALEKYSANAEYAYQSYYSTKLPIDPLTMARSRVAGVVGAR